MDRNKVIRLLSEANLELDKLQVELNPKTPYEIPNSDETRERILKAMDYLEEVSIEVGLMDKPNN